MAVITGTPRGGEIVTSDTAGQWAINGLPVIGERGYRLLTPWSVSPGDLIAQEGSNTLAVPAYDTDAADYFIRAEAWGGSFSSATMPANCLKWRIDAMFRELKSTGAWGAIAELYLMMGVDFAGLRAKAKYLVTDSMIPVGFADSDYVPLGPSPGLANAGTHHMDTDLSPSDILGDPAVMPGLGALMVCDLPTSGSGLIFGTEAISGGSAFGYHATSTVVRFRFQSSQSLSGSNPSERCCSAFLTDPTAAMRAIGDVVLGPYGYDKGSGVSSSTMKLFDTASGGFPFVGRMMAAWALLDATPQQVVDLHAAIQKARASLDQSPYPRTVRIVLRSPVKNVLRNSTGNRATVRLIDSYGEPLTGIPAGDVTITAGPEGGTAVPVAVAGSWTERSGGRYDFAMPDVLYTGTERIYIEGTLAGGTVLGDCHQIVGYDRLEPWATPGDIAAIGAVIPGDDAQTLTLTCTADGQPVAGVVIRIAGRRLVTSTAGVATVDLDPGSYTARYTPPAGFSVVPDGAIVITAAPVGVAVSLEQQELDPGDSTACPTRFITLNQFDAPARGITIQVEFLRFLESPPKPGIIVNTPEQLTITNADAFVDAYLHRNALYQATFSRGTWRISRSVQFTTPTEGNLIVTEPDH